MSQTQRQARDIEIVREHLAAIASPALAFAALERLVADLSSQRGDAASAEEK